jgi:hypothetical protein
MKITAGVSIMLSVLIGGYALPPSEPTLSDKVEKGSIAAIGNMNFRRFAHTSTLLPNGKVLVAGGQDGGALATTEIFDPVTNRFASTGTMGSARAGHTATLLPDGKVLIAGGYDATYLSSAEIYDPKSREFTATSHMSIARSGHEAILLNTGKVLLVGGVGIGWSFLSSAEIYDPETGTFTPTGSMTTARESHTATLLSNGRVFVTGGHKGRRAAITIYSSAEVYDPSSGTFLPTGNMSVRRHKHDAALLSDGRVLVVGGADERDRDGAYTSAEIYDPNNGQFTPAANMNARRYKHRSTTILLPTGQVLVVGGSYTAELYDPASNQFVKVNGSMGSDRLFSAATLLQNGRVLITGGYDESMTTSSRAWLYQ